MLSITARPGILSFALGFPAPELFPAAAYSQAISHVLATDVVALQYSPPLKRLKSHIVALMARRGVVCSEEQVFLTSGAQQGMNLLARLLLEHGGPVLLEEISYTGMQIVLEPFQPRILTVPTDLDTGMDVDAVEMLLANGARPAFIYSMTESHNPLGVSLSLDKRIRLAELARRYCVPVVEDDVYGFLNYDGTPLPPVRKFEAECVYYIGSFSKILAPALRVGWVVVPEHLTPLLSLVKDATDLDCSALSQRLVSAYLDSGHLDAHLEVLCREYRMRRDTMVEALAQHLPEGTSWVIPTGGLFIWVELPHSIDAGALLKTAVETEQVAYIPGYVFCSGKNGYKKNCMRLNFSNCNPEKIRDGIARLGRVVKAAHR
jgi:2-aminoadipate transaminase